MGGGGAGGWEFFTRNGEKARIWGECFYNEGSKNFKVSLHSVQMDASPPYFLKTSNRLRVFV